MAFTYDLSTDLGKIRLKLADTDSSAYAFEDAEIQVFIDEGATVNAAVVLGFNVLVADGARREKSATIQGLSIDDKGRVAALIAARAVYETASIPLAEVSFGGLIPSDENYTEPTV